MDRPPFEYVNMRDLEVDPSQLGDNAIVGLGTGFPETIQQPYSTTLNGIPDTHHAGFMGGLTPIGIPPAGGFRQEEEAYRNVIPSQESSDYASSPPGRGAGNSRHYSPGAPTYATLSPIEPTSDSSYTPTDEVSSSGGPQVAVSLAISNETPSSSQESQSEQPASSFTCEDPDCQPDPPIYETRRDLNHHLRNHISKAERPYPCNHEDCKKAFLFPKDLRRHRKTHAPDKFRCTKCDNEYTRQDYLDRHMRRKHTNSAVLTTPSASPRVAQSSSSRRARSSAGSGRQCKRRRRPSNQTGPSAATPSPSRQSQRAVTHDESNIDPRLRPVSQSSPTPSGSQPRGSQRTYAAVAATKLSASQSVSSYTASPNSDGLFSSKGSVTSDMTSTSRSTWLSSSTTPRYSCPPSQMRYGNSSARTVSPVFLKTPGRADAYRPHFRGKKSCSSVDTDLSTHFSNALHLRSLPSTPTRKSRPDKPKV